MRHITALDNANLLQSYIENLYQFTYQCFSSNMANQKQINKELMVAINHVWYRLHMELTNLKHTFVEQVASLVHNIIEV